MFMVIHERQVMTNNTEAHGFSEDEAATSAYFNKVFSSHMCMTIYIHSYTRALLKHSSKKACHISMTL